MSHGDSHRCIRCHRDFPSSEVFDSHIRKSSLHNICVVCNVDCPSERSLKQHYVNSIDHICCRTCLRVFLTNQALLQHYKDSWQHHYCSLCDCRFGNAAELREHNESVSVHRFCQRCNKGFADVENLRSHNREEHYVCTICEWVFDTPDKQLKHAVDSHPYCGDCKRGFRTAEDLFKHYLEKHEITEIICQGNGCGKPFNSYGALTQHFDSGACPSGLTHDRLSELVVDSYRNRTIAGLKKLVRPPTSNTPLQIKSAEHCWDGRKYACPLCHKSFISYQQFCAHLRARGHDTHLFRCPNQSAWCGVEFGTFSALVQHLESGKCGVRRFVKIKDLLELLNLRVGMVKN